MIQPDFNRVFFFCIFVFFFGEEEWGWGVEGGGVGKGEYL